MRIEKYKLGFIGFGHMAQIIWGGLDRMKWFPHSQIFFLQKDKSKQKENSKKYHITSVSLEKLIEKSDVIFFCVRPQHLPRLLRDFPKQDYSSKFLISILAATPISAFENHFGKDAQILRVMPNACIEVDEGMNLLSFNRKCSEEFIHFGKLLFNSLGKAEEIPENLMDAGLGLSASGVAFVFKLIETFAKKGVKEGFSMEQSLKIVSQTFLGASKMIEEGRSPEKLLIQIATPGGTTERGLKVFEDSTIEKDLRKAIHASIQRSRELRK